MRVNEQATKYSYILPALVIWIIVCITSVRSADLSATKINYGGTFTDTLIVDPKSLNLWTAQETSTANVTGLLFDSLIARNAQTLRWEARLAEMPEVSSDGLLWTFKLRPNLKWSDGRALTADDVIFTLDVIYDERTHTNWRESMLVEAFNTKTKKIERRPPVYRKADERTILIRFPRPYAPAHEMLSFPIAPRHKLEAAWKAGRFNSAWAINTPVEQIISSGPWILESYEPGKRVVYRRNPNFWKKGEQGRALPYLDKYVLLIVSDINSMQQAFLGGKSDVLSLQAPEYSRLKAKLKTGEDKGEYRTFDLGPGWGFSFLGFNVNPNAKLDANKRALFQNVKFRRAVSHAVNRAAIVKDVFGGKAQPLYGPLTSADTTFYNPNLPHYTYDVAKARRLLQEIGLRDANKNGLFEWKGREVNINIVTNVENNQRRDMGASIVRDLRKIGLKATLTPVTFNTLITRLDGPPYPWEATILGFTGGPEPHSGAHIWKSSGNLHLWYPSQKSPATPWEAEVDELFRRGAATLDEAERKKIYNRWQVIMAEQQPLTFLVAPHRLIAVRSRFGNVKPTSLGGATWNLEEIFDRRQVERLNSEREVTPAGQD